MATGPDNPPIDKIASECIAVRLRMLNRAVTKIYDDALRPLGLRVSQMNILVATGKMGTARPAEICQRLNLEVSTLSRNVDRMKARGWIEIVADDDGRAQPFRLTAEGKAVLKKATPGWVEAQRQAAAILGEDVVQRLSEAIGRLRGSA